MRKTMRKAMQAVGALALSGVLATFALQEVSQLVVTARVDRVADNGEALAAVESVPEPRGDAEFSSEDTAALDSWYAEEATEEGEGEFYEEEPSSDESEESSSEQRSEYEEQVEDEPVQDEPA